LQRSTPQNQNGLLTTSGIGHHSLIRLLLPRQQAFRPGNVDMTVDQAAPNKNVITLQAERVDLDNFLADLNW
jgi:hypothetical protein